MLGHSALRHTALVHGKVHALRELVRRLLLRNAAQGALQGAWSFAFWILRAFMVLLLLGTS